MRNKLEICKKCGNVLTKKIEQPDRVVIIIKVVCESCKKEKEFLNSNIPMRREVLIESELNSNNFKDAGYIIQEVEEWK
jgi:DNA-directed RNA polymerase subunit M/transcription elongation factor TFIIS